MPSRTRRSHALGVELVRQGLDAKPLARIALKEAHHHGSDLRVYLEPAALRDGVAVRVLAGDDRNGAIAEGRAARGELAIEAPAQAAAGVVADLLEVLLVHHPHHLGADVLEVEATGNLDPGALADAQTVADPA